MTQPETITHYRITAKLGEGGMGAVYRATDTKLNRDVAIKVLPEAFAQDADRMARFGREAQVLASLNHPNIAAIYGVEERALVLELVEGPTLAERIAKGPIPLDEALAIARQIAEAFEYAHDKGIVHRDLKPANVKVTPEGRVKVLDFGLAKAISGDGVSADPANSPTLTMRATVAGVILGTAGYMAPEQAKGKGVDKRADIWAYGVVLYEMLTGGRLFAGETVSDTLAAVLTKEPDVERVPAPVRKLLRSCLEKDPKRRLRDIGDAWRLLEEAPAAAATAPSRSRLGSAWVGVSGVLAVAAAVLALVHFREAPPPRPVVRFSVPPPPKNVFGSWLAVSPDGRHLAFPAGGPDGVTRVWVRSLDSLEARPLAGTEGGVVTCVFWSPDGRFLVFQQGNKVKKIDIGGGPPETLSDSPNTLLGGAWSAGGVILLGGNSGPIVRVSPAGGTAAPVTHLDRPRGDTFHSDPIFLPDGRHFLYFRHSSKAENQGVFAGSLDAKPEEQSLKRILPVDFSPGYVPPGASRSLGYLLFLREETLMAQPFDDRRLETTGEPVPVAEHIGTSVSRAFFSASPAGVLAWRGGGGVQQLGWYNRDGQFLGRAGDPADYHDVALSPDGTRVAFSRGTQGAGLQIWILDLARGVQTRVTFLHESVRSPVWSPDGRYLAFSSLSGRSLYVQVVNAAGSAEPVFEGPVTAVNHWSPDGRYLLFTQAPNGSDLMALSNPSSGGERKAIPVANSEATEWHGQASPDSRFVAYESNESGTSEVYLRPFPPGDERAAKWLVSSNGGAQPRWRGDGKELYYIDPGHTVMAVDVNTQATPPAGTPHRLFTPPAINYLQLMFQYDVTRDGKRFLIIGPMEGAVMEPATVVLNWEEGLRK
jgi:Tol biopolymer transport system component